MRATSHPSFSAKRKVLTSFEYGDLSGASLNSSAISLSVRYTKYKANNAESVGHVRVRVYDRP